MTYAELVTRLRKRAKELPERFSKNEENIRLFLAAADVIEELSREYESVSKDLVESVELCRKLRKPKWIPVTERLPEIDMSYPHHEDYLVQYDSGNMDVASWSNVNRFWTDHVTEPHWNCVQFAEVIAWMPLPQPPKEETK